MEALIEDFLQHLRHERGQAEHTQRTYAALLKQFVTWAGENGLSDWKTVELRHLMSFLQHERERYLSREPKESKRWLRTGKPTVIKELPRLDEALKEFLLWLEPTTELREKTKINLRNRVGNFIRGVANKRVTAVMPEHVETYLAARNVSPDTKDADCRAISSFFTWCMKGKRHWCINNPCYAVEIDGRTGDDDREPVVLAVEECERLLRAAEGFEAGRLVPYVALCLVGGLRLIQVREILADALPIAFDATHPPTGRLRTGIDKRKNFEPLLRCLHIGCHYI